MWLFFSALTLNLMLNDWISEVSKHKQLLFFSFGNFAFLFSWSWSDVCLFLFLLSFPAFLDQTRALHQVFLLTVYTTGVKISRIFLESDEYLCPLTIRLHQVWYKLTYFQFKSTFSDRKYKENVRTNKMYLVIMILAVKRKLWVIFLPRGSSWSIANTWKPA